MFYYILEASLVARWAGTVQNITPAVSLLPLGTSSTPHRAAEDEFCNNLYPSPP